MAELSPYERQNEYYSNIQLGKNVKRQTELLANQTSAMIAAQAASTNAIIASQTGIRENLKNMSYSVEDIADGMYGMKAAFEFGISEVVWQIEQNRQVLQDILETLIAPLATQAKELRRRAEDAYANGWYDDALKDFLKSEKKNKYDFAVQISIGLIYFFHYDNREKALEYFKKATKYARPKSPYHASFALLHSALIERDFGHIAEAERMTSEATVLSQDFAEAFYQNAQYNAQLNNVEKSLAAIEKAVKLDRNYCIKADADEMLEPVREQILALIERLRDQIKPACFTLFERLDKALKQADLLFSKYSKVFNGFHEHARDLSVRLTQIRHMLRKTGANGGVHSFFQIGLIFIGFEYFCRQNTRVGDKRENAVTGS